MGRTGQDSPFGPFFHFQCDTHPIHTLYSVGLRQFLLPGLEKVAILRRTKSVRYKSSGLVHCSRARDCDPTSVTLDTARARERSVSEPDPPSNFDPISHLRETQPIKLNRTETIANRGAQTYRFLMVYMSSFFHSIVGPAPST